MVGAPPASHFNTTMGLFLRLIGSFCIFSSALPASGEQAASPLETQNNECVSSLDESNTASISVPIVLKSLDSLCLLRTPRQLKRLVLVGTSSMRGNTAPLVLDERRVTALSPTGVYKVTSTLGVSYTTFLGLFDLEREMTVGNLRVHYVATSVVLGGDWKLIPVGSQIDYTTTMRIEIPSLARTTEATSKVVCQVIEKVTASTLFPTLTGDAKRLECLGGASEVYKRTSNWYLLNDYGYAVELSDNQMALSSFLSRHITEVEQ